MLITLKQKALELDGDLSTVTGLFLDRIGGRGGILLESAEVDGRWGRFSLAAGDFPLLARNSGGRLALDIHDERLTPLAEFAGLPYLDGLRKVMDAIRIEPEAGDEFPPITRALYGYLDYDAARLLTPHPALDFDPGAEGGFCLAGNIYLFDHGYNRLTRLSLVPGAAETPARSSGPLKAGPERSSFSREEYMKAAGEIRELIRRGECGQALLSNRFSAPFSGDLFEAYRRLRRLSPSPYMFYLNFPEISLALSSPELLVTCDRGRLRLRPVAGERPPEEEESLFEEEFPQSDPREEAEHLSLVEAARGELELVAAPGTVRVERFMEAERFSRTLELSSLLSAELDAGRHPLDVLAAVFPSAALSGLPKARAMEVLARYEPGPRGPYGGAMGWLGLDKEEVSLDFGVTTRCLWRKGDQVFWRAGSRLTRDSDPARAWKECLQNAALPRAALLLEPGEEKRVAPPLRPARGLAPLTPRHTAGDGRMARGHDGELPCGAEGGGAPFPLPVIMETLAEGRDLSREMAAQLFDRLMDGELSPAQAGALLMGLRAKGETPLEMAEAATAVLKRAITPPPLGENVLDIVGTGGDGRNSFNCSTGAALVMAGLGHRVVKHGNRSVSSRCGSADVLELLGLDLNAPPESVPDSLREKNFAFLFAPNYHPSFRHVMPVRKELGIRALFNILGPLVNPAKPAHSLLGAPNMAVLPLLAGALARLGTVFSAVVHGAGGYDEMTTLGPARVFLVEGDKIEEMAIDPAAYGFAPRAESELAISGPEEGAAVLRELLAGRGPRAMREMLILNVAMALYIKNGAEDFGRQVKEARRALEDGAGLKTL